MKTNKDEKILWIYNCIRVIILVAFLVFLFIGLAQAQPYGDKVSFSKQKMPERVSILKEI